MTRSTVLRPVLLVAMTTVALVVAVALGAAQDVALAACILFLGGLALAGRVRDTSAVLPASGDLGELIRRREIREERVPQLATLERRFDSGRWSTLDLHHRLRPLVCEIAAARLARGHGVDLDREPERAHALVGPHVWELVRPERQPPQERLAPGWPPKELWALVEELERI
jgi:hypothetical protein